MSKKLLLGLVIVLGIAAAAVLYLRKQEEPHEQQVAVQPEQPAVVKEETKEPAIRFPMPEPQIEDQAAEQVVEQAKPLPSLDESDSDIQGALTSLFGQDTFMKLFIAKDMIRHMVVTIDNLPRHQYAVKYLPTYAVAGRFLASGEEESKVINPENYRRYAPYIRLAETVDSKAIVAVYVRLYPLFQQAYEDLGYPSDYFNDRLIDVIDHLLDTPDVKDPVKLVQPRVLYEYADAELEALSAGQKILVRMGSDNASRIKAKLRGLRHELTANITGD